jgi:hypothetical protein
MDMVQIFIPTIMPLVRNIYFIVSHIFIWRGTMWQIIKLANLGHGIIDSLWFDSCLMIFRSDLVSSKFGLPNFRFS